MRRGHVLEHDVKGVEALPGCVLSRAVALGAAAPGTVTVKNVKQEAASAVSAHPKEHNLRKLKPLRVVQTAAPDPPRKKPARVKRESVKPEPRTSSPKRKKSATKKQDKTAIKTDSHDGASLVAGLSDSDVQRIADAIAARMPQPTSAASPTASVGVMGSPVPSNLFASPQGVNFNFYINSQPPPPLQ
jgi:hypothetical protein